MASAELSRRVEKVVRYPPLSEMSKRQRREFHEALLEAASFEDLPGKWQAAILQAERNRPNLRLVSDAYACVRGAGGGLLLRVARSGTQVPASVHPASASSVAPIPPGASR
jgi:hypothetical protein